MARVTSAAAWRGNLASQADGLHRGLTPPGSVQIGNNPVWPKSPFQPQGQPRG